MITIMQITNVTIYAIQALRELNQGASLTTDEIARRLDISFDYAAKVMRGLRATGIVKNDRWGAGGYILTKSLDKATLIEFLSIIDNGLLDDQEGETRDMRAIRRKLKQLIDAGLSAPVTSIL